MKVQRNDMMIIEIQGQEFQITTKEAKDLRDALNTALEDTITPIWPVIRTWTAELNIPSCCISCSNYKAGTMCNCSLPAMEQGRKYYFESGSTSHDSNLL